MSYPSGHQAQVVRLYSDLMRDVEAEKRRQRRERAERRQVGAVIVIGYLIAVVGLLWPPMALVVGVPAVLLCLALSVEIVRRWRPKSKRREEVST